MKAVDLRVDVERVDGARLVRVLEGDLDPGGWRFWPGQSPAIRTFRQSPAIRTFRLIRTDDGLRDGKGGQKREEKDDSCFHGGAVGE